MILAMLEERGERGQWACAYDEAGTLLLYKYMKPAEQIAPITSDE